MKEAAVPRIADWCAEHGILFVADEVQTGFCRTGDWFACDHEGVVPDLITTAKGIAGGLPLGAVTGRGRSRRCSSAGWNGWPTSSARSATYVAAARCLRSNWSGPTAPPMPR